MGTGVTVFGFQFENWQKKNSPHKDILSTYLLDVTKRTCHG